ncbi:sugar phosphate isomerase/epimerase family protein [Leptospira levettii]|uniref:Sugar phosphate isomerase/epimerase n=1 Tax=Leptospira levettii TaxID=2023178 RepID=A0AAW5V938_9LEPT|nr:sugar phosphate isomerase/epimerase family protein [Leptospira levettii]MCW7466197.1 sugar phosphate isomerase/epimerase [Leptospira levettii]MCW7512278.1 sugar phosphate isomerase/epimerase [Leptospira levettii]MCW7516286.1 sugar phosphate isomerase/epimerase [Leptospira levettii]
MKNLLGVMQGRLLPKFNGRYQAHPVGYWQDEFPIAQSLGLNCIEFILDFNDFDKNPLTSEVGIGVIKESIKETGVKVVSICADYFMEAPFHSKDLSIVKNSQKVLSLLLKHGNEIGVKDIVIPCVDQSSLKSESDKKSFYENLSPLLKEAESSKIHLSLETDLGPKDFLDIIQMFNSEFVSVNYDIGNSASLGFDPVEEFSEYGKYITDIHIKDRKLNSGSIELGKGDAQFNKVLLMIQKINYTGPFIMQAYRDDEGLEIFKRQLDWVRRNF